jgi:hypothetical protein
VRFTFAILLLLGAASTSFGDLVVSYSAVSDIGNSAPNPPFSAHDDVSGDDLSTGSGLTPVADSAFWEFAGWTEEDFGHALVANDVWQWGFDVTGNVALDLTTMNVTLNTKNTGPSNVEIQAAINGGTPVSLLSVSGLTNSVVVYPVNLSALPTLGMADSIVFTLAGWGSSSIGSLLLANAATAIVVNGNFSPAAIPEPNAFWLGAVVCGLAAGAGCLRLARAKRTRH